MDDKSSSFSRGRVRHSMSQTITKQDLKHLKAFHKRSISEIKKAKNSSKKTRRKLLKHFDKLQIKLRFKEKCDLMPDQVVEKESSQEFSSENILSGQSSVDAHVREKEILDEKVKQLEEQYEDARVIITDTIHKFLSQQTDLNKLQEKASQLSQSAQQFELDTKVVKKTFYKRNKKTLRNISVLCAVFMIFTFVILMIIYETNKSLE